MVRVLALLLLLAALAGPGVARANAELCRAAIAAAERDMRVPDRLMQAIGVIESGRRDPGGAVLPWPWTINVEGVGEVFDTKAQAIAAVQAHRARGARSIDVGCMQVNLMYHGDAFASLEEAFDPAANARYAARFLLRLLDQQGSWPRAVAGYHSLTPERGEDYARKVLTVWARPEPRRGAAQLASAPPPSPGAVGAPPLGGVASLPSGTMGGRILPTAGSGGPAMTGRGLDSYRAMPTQLVAGAIPRRS
jgi:hypothetical protein